MAAVSASMTTSRGRPKRSLISLNARANSLFIRPVLQPFPFGGLARSWPITKKSGGSPLFRTTNPPDKQGQSNTGGRGLQGLARPPGAFRSGVYSAYSHLLYAEIQRRRRDSPDSTTPCDS